MNNNISNFTEQTTLSSDTFFIGYDEVSKSEIKINYSDIVSSLAGDVLQDVAEITPQAAMDLIPTIYDVETPDSEVHVNSVSELNNSTIVTLGSSVSSVSLLIEQNQEVRLNVNQVTGDFTLVQVASSLSSSVPISSNVLVGNKIVFASANIPNFAVEPRSANTIAIYLLGSGKGVTGISTAAAPNSVITGPATGKYGCESVTCHEQRLWHMNGYQKISLEILTSLAIMETFRRAADTMTYISPERTKSEQVTNEQRKRFVNALPPAKDIQAVRDLFTTATTYGKIGYPCCINPITGIDTPILDTVLDRIIAVLNIGSDRMRTIKVSVEGGGIPKIPASAMNNWEAQYIKLANLRDRPGYDAISRAVGNRKKYLAGNCGCLKSLPDHIYSITAPKNAIDEGESIVVTFNFKNVPVGEKVAYKIEGTATAADLNNANMSGSFTSRAYASDTHTITLKATGDMTNEGAENIVIKMGNKSLTIKINDTSRAPIPSYTLTVDKASVNEGGTVTFTLTTKNVADNTSLSYNVTGIDQDDLLQPTSPLAGTFVVKKSKATVSFKIKNDIKVEGQETMVCKLGVSNTNVAASVKINDTSTKPNAYLNQVGTELTPLEMDAIRLHGLEGETVGVSGDGTVVARSAVGYVPSSNSPSVVKPGVWVYKTADDTLSDFIPVNQDHIFDNFSSIETMFGFNVRLNEWGNIIAVSEPNIPSVTGNNVQDAGRVTVYTSSRGGIASARAEAEGIDTTWKRLGTWGVSNSQSYFGAAAFNYSGMSMDLDASGTIIAIGTPGGVVWNRVSTPQNGKVEVFKYDSASNKWMPLGQVISGTGTRQRFSNDGVFLSRDGRRLIVLESTPFYDDINLPKNKNAKSINHTITVHTYNFDNTKKLWVADRLWTKTYKVANPFAVAGSMFRADVNANCDTVIIRYDETRYFTTDKGICEAEVIRLAKTGWQRVGNVVTLKNTLFVVGNGRPTVKLNSVGNMFTVSIPTNANENGYVTGSRIDVYELHNGSWMKSNVNDINYDNFTDMALVALNKTNNFANLARSTRLVIGTTRRITNPTTGIIQTPGIDVYNIDNFNKDPDDLLKFDSRGRFAKTMESFRGNYTNERAGTGMSLNSHGILAIGRTLKAGDSLNTSLIKFYNLEANGSWTTAFKPIHTKKINFANATWNNGPVGNVAIDNKSVPMVAVVDGYPSKTTNTDAIGVRVYEFKNSNWSTVGTWVNSTFPTNLATFNTTDTRLGDTLHIGNNVLVFNSRTNENGRISTYNYANSQWLSGAALTYANASTASFACNTSTDTLVLAQPNFSATGKSLCGRIIIYSLKNVKNILTWTQSKVIEGVAANERLGVSVSISDKGIIAACNGLDSVKIFSTNGTQLHIIGSVISQLTNTSANLYTKINPAAGTIRFSTHCDISPDSRFLTVGSIQDNTNHSLISVFYFNDRTNTWGLITPSTSDGLTLRNNTTLSKTTVDVIDGKIILVNSHPGDTNTSELCKSAVNCFLPNEVNVGTVQTFNLTIPALRPAPLPPATTLRPTPVIMSDFILYENVFFTTTYN
jgi:hypothetical protein